MIRECTRCRSGARVSASADLSYAANEQVQYQSPFGGGSVTYATNEQATQAPASPAPAPTLAEAAASFASQFGGGTSQTQSPIATQSARLPADAPVSATSDPFAGTFGGQSVSQYEAAKASRGGYKQQPSSYDPYQTKSGCGGSCKCQRLACDDRNGCNRKGCSCSCPCKKR